MIRRHLYITGKVKGVFFRDSCRKMAEELSVKGWVRNIPAGVEVAAEGEDAQVRQLVEWCRRGPPGAAVERVEIKEEKFKREFTEFKILG